MGLPRFEFTVPTFELTEAWRTLGLANTVSHPDFDAMLETDNPNPLKIDVYHKTFIKVDEKGTEASAATAVSMEIGSAVEEAPPPKPLVIIFDRPFAFVLRHWESGAVLLLGRVEDPEKL